MSEKASSPHTSGTAPDWEAIARHFAGESTPAESAVVRAWLAANAGDERILAMIGEASARLAERSGRGVDVEAALTRVHDRMYQRDASVVPLRPAARAPSHFWLSRGLAAAAAIIVIVGVSLYRRAPASQNESHVFATTTAQRDSIRLADGSSVILGPESRLEVPAGFAAGVRTVHLEGEAYFDVVHDANHPFSVAAGGVTITDVGTRFAVHHDPATGVSVAVTDGIVDLTTATAAHLVLNAGAAADVDLAGRIVPRPQPVTDADVAWTKGQLIFRDAPMDRVRSDLHRWYGVELVIPDSSLAQRHLTATFAQDSRTQVLDVLALTLGATYELRGDTAVLRPGQPAATRK
jgi:transmembrane sensor